MPSVFTQTLASPYLLYTTSILSFLFASFIKSRVQRKGPVSFASALIKYNSLFYAVVSLYLFIGILISIWTEISQTTNPSLRTVICSHSTFSTDHALRYLYHFSKFYEYVDIFNVLAVGGVVNTHFSVHHFTVSYHFNSQFLKPLPANQMIDTVSDLCSRTQTPRRLESLCWPQYIASCFHVRLFRGSRSILGCASHNWLSTAICGDFSRNVYHFEELSN